MATFVDEIRQEYAKKVTFEDVINAIKNHVSFTYDILKVKDIYNKEFEEYGKSLNVLLVVAETAHKSNWKEEIDHIWSEHQIEGGFKQIFK